MSLRVGRKDIGVGKLIKYRKKFSDNDLKQKRIIRESVIKRYEKIDNDTLIEGFSSLSYEDDYDDREVGEAEEEDPEEAVELEGGEEKEAPPAAATARESIKGKFTKEQAAAAKESIKGKFTKEQVDKVKLIPSEYLNVPIPPEEKDYHETSFKYIGISIDATEFIQKYLSKCYITDTEIKTLSQAMKDSKGFDLPSLPYRALVSAMVTPMYLVNNDDAEKMAKYSKLAVRHYNKIHDKRYVFKQLVKANLQTARGLLFRITFMAMNAHPPNRLETFQAEVFEDIGDDIQILLCRIKPRK